MSTSIVEHKNGRKWRFGNKFYIDAAVLNIVVQASGLANTIFSQ